MAIYEPHQPVWKRGIAGFLDGALALFVFSFSVAELFGTRNDAPGAYEKAFAGFKTEDAAYTLDGGPVLLIVLLFFAYFIVLGQTGGTVFQRLFGMRRTTWILKKIRK